MTSTSLGDHLQQASTIAEAHWGVRGDAVRLPGENLNVRISEAVLKIAREPQIDPDLEEALGSALLKAGLPVPRSRAAIDGRRVVETDLGAARLQDVLPGEPWSDIADTPEVLAAVGDLIGRLHLATAAFDHPRAQRTHAWDLARAGQHRSGASLIEDDRLRAAVDRALHLHAAVDLSALPRGMLHGDVNDENVLFEGARVSALLDLGDALHGPLVCDLAIAVAYALQHEGTGLDEAASLVEAGDALRPLEPDEQQALFPLVLARLATSIVVSQMQRRAGGTHLQSTDDALLSVIDLHPRDAELVLCSGCTVHRGPGSDPDQLRARRASVLGSSLTLSHGDSPLHIVAGRGQFLHASNGEAYLDLVNNVCHVGHCHPHVVGAIARQAARLNTNTRYLHATVLELADRLTATMPEELSVCFFVNSGSEANELALRLCRAATGAFDVAVIDRAYHGNTTNCISMSPYKFDGPGGAGCAPWVHVTPAPDAFRGEFADDSKGEACALEVGRVISEAAAQGRRIAGFFAESLLSCGGQVPLPGGYLTGALEHVRKAGGLYVADEVQVGFGRVGEAMWGFQLHDVVPDIVVLGKPMGNGHPIGAVVTTPEIARAFAGGDVGDGMEFFSTFGGNPVSCAAALAVLEVIEQEGLQARAAEAGEHCRRGLCDLQQRHALIGDVRGSGLFLGVELVRDRRSLEPADMEARAIVESMCRSGVLLSTDGPLHNVIKIKPPMVLTDDDIDMTIRLLDRALSAHA